MSQQYSDDRKTWLKDRLNRVVGRPPVRSYINDQGRTVEEEQTLVGFVVANEDQRSLLNDYGICLELAEFNTKTQRWERCLFSEAVADMLQSLCDEGQFPHSFEAAPSVAELDWFERRLAGEETRAPHPLRAYYTPATVERLAQLEADEQRHLIRRMSGPDRSFN